MLSYAFVGYFNFCLLLCLLSYCATSFRGISLWGGGVLEIQTYVCMSYFIGLLDLRGRICSWPRDGPWNHSRHGDRFFGSGDT